MKDLEKELKEMSWKNCKEIEKIKVLAKKKYMHPYPKFKGNIKGRDIDTDISHLKKVSERRCLNCNKVFNPLQGNKYIRLCDACKKQRKYSF
jgi:hypothetical protein